MVTISPGLVLETAFCLAFFGFLKCGEFTSKSNTFNPLADLIMQDIQVFVHNRYFTFQLKSSKTDPFHRGVTVKYFATGKSICPFQLALLQTRTEMVARPRDPLFTTVAGTPGHGRS